MFHQNKLIGITIALSVIVVITTYVSWLAGFQGFLLVGNIMMPVWLTYIMGALMFYITFVLWTGVSLNEYSIKLLKVTFPFLIIYVILTILFPILNGTLIISTLIPFIYISLWGLKYKDIKNTTKRNLQYSIIVILYQIASTSIKLSFFNFNQLEIGIFEFLIFQIDSLIFQALLFSFGGELFYHVKLGFKFIWMDRQNNNNVKHIHSSSARKRIEQSDELNETFKEFNSLSKWERNFTILLFLGIQILQCIIVLLVCHFVGNAFLEALVILTSFVAHGFILKERFHSKSIIVCTILSSILFLVISKITPSFYLFQLLPIIIGLLLTYSLYKIYMMKKQKTFERWYNNIINLTTGKYATVGNHLEVAKSKGFKGKDLELIGYSYSVTDEFSKTLGRIFSPWHDGKYVRNVDVDEGKDPPE